MVDAAPSFYERHRARDWPTASLNETPGAPPAESLVQAIWQHQRLRRTELKTLDGRPLRVLHPGFRNHAAGPDFSQAIIQIDHGPILTGKIEVDLVPGGWKAHRHDTNPAFNDVILHVLWQGDRSGDSHMPAVALSPFLDAPLAQLHDELGRDLAAALPEELRGHCCAPLRELDAAQLTALLFEAAHVRFRFKAHQLLARARDAGWEQALWEGLFRALGYQQNVWPMQNLAELRPRWESASTSPQSYQALLFGIGGLLPGELPESAGDADDYLRTVWHQWWRERDRFAECLLPRALWRFHQLRPANHPQRRLALAASWLTAGDLPARLEAWFKSSVADDDLLASLVPILQGAPHEFWSWHWTLNSARLPKPQPLLGANRVTDLAINVILPWFWVRAVQGKNAALQRVAEHRYLSWPAAEDNRVLKLARQRLLAGAGQKALRSAAAQQGLLQVVKDFCGRSNALCEGCRFPELVRDFAQLKRAVAA